VAVQRNTSVSLVRGGGELEVVHLHKEDLGPGLGHLRVSILSGGTDESIHDRTFASSLNRDSVSVSRFTARTERIWV
jgi:hypothetical protein